MSSTNQPVILIVHGGYFFAEAFQNFQSELLKAGYESRCPQLPSCRDTRPLDQKAGQPEDIAVIRKAAHELISSGRSIIVLAHSYGGIVACGAISNDMLASSDSGGRAGVLHMVFLSCWLLLPGSTVEDLLKKYGFQMKVALATNEDGTVYSTNSPEAFYNDIYEEDPSRAETLAKANNTTHNWVTATLPVQGSPWKTVSSTYVHCKRDQAILLPLQKSMVSDAQTALESADKSVTMDALEIDTGHCPFASAPEELVQIIKSIDEKSAL